MTLANLAGIIGSDGHLGKNENLVAVINKDKDFIEKNAIPLLKKFSKKNISVRKTSSGYGSGKYLVRIWDKSLKNNLENKFNIPKGKKQT